jgi:hypothetical protein
LLRRKTYKALRSSRGSSEVERLHNLGATQPYEEKSHPAFPVSVRYAGVSPLLACCETTL